MKIPSYCKGCIYRSSTHTDFNSCDFMFATGIPRGCPAGPGCTKYTAYGKKWSKKNDITIKQKRIILTPEERREHRNALRRNEYAQKKIRPQTAI